MKIYFLVAQSEGRFPDLKVWYTKANNYIEANRVIKGSIDRKTCELLEVLQDNQDFITDIRAIRKEFNIPANGYPIQEWDKVKNERKEDKSYLQWRLKLDKASRELSKRYKIPYLLQSSLMYIVIGNYIYLPLTKIFLERPNELVPIYDGPDVKIALFGKVSKQQLFNFIDENWTIIKQEMNVFTDEASAFVSSRDREIITLRDDKNMKFTEIADLLAERTDNFEINEDMVKKAYHRAKDRIAALKKGQ